MTEDELKKQIFEDIEKSYVDAKEYYANHGKLRAVIPYKEASEVLSESEATKVLSERGFNYDAITTEYTAEGKMIDAKEVEESDETHPVYQTHFVSETGEYWTIIVTKRSMIANPAGYNMELNTHGVQLVVSESEEITCYDGVTNSFFETVPDESELIIRVVERIDAATLNSLTPEKLG